jgi:flagellar hook-associated protein 1
MFQGLSTALTALYAQQKALETTGNNIANANTEGYSRQRVDMDPLAGSRWASFHAQPSKVGQGVTISDISRLRDDFLDMRSIQEHSKHGSMARSATTLDSIERAFGEPGDTGLQAQMADFWATWDDVTTQPDSVAARTQVIEQAHTLTSAFSAAANSLDQLQESSLEKLKNNISSLNAMAQNVADLNDAIRSATNAGGSPNELLDQRDLLISKMSDLADISVQKTSAGSVAVSVGGTAIVRDDRVTTLLVDSNTPPGLRWDTDGDVATVGDSFAANVTGGDVGGLLNSMSTVIPKYQQLLDDVANSLMTAVNDQHQLGVDLNGNPGAAFFTGTGAKDMAVSAALSANPNLLAAAEAGGGALDGENARAIANFASAQNGADATYRQMINILGVESQRATRQLESQVNILNAADGAKESVAGVNMDEEMTNLIRHQKSYNAAAKYLSTMDQVLDSLINIIR